MRAALLAGSDRRKYTSMSSGMRLMNAMNTSSGTRLDNGATTSSSMQQAMLQRTEQVTPAAARRRTTSGRKHTHPPDVKITHGRMSHA